MIVDDYSRYMWLELLTSKDQALHFIKLITTSVKGELGEKLKVMRTDRGGKFNSVAFTTFCTDHGIKHYTTAPYTP
jgi:hypothetical protein